MASPTKRSWTPVVKEKPIFISRNITAKVMKKMFGDVSFQGIEKDFSVTDATKKLLEAVGVSLSKLNDDKLKGYAERLEEAKIWYHAFEKGEDRPSPNEKRRALEEVKNKAHALVVCMKELDEDSKTSLESMLQGTIGPQGPDSMYARAWGLVERVGEAAGEAIKIIPKSRLGRRRSTAQKNVMINHLRPIYKDLTKKDPFKKTTSQQVKAHFLDFVEKFLEAIERPAQSRRALITALSRTKKTSPKKKHS